MKNLILILGITLIFWACADKDPWIKDFNYEKTTIPFIHLEKEFYNSAQTTSEIIKKHPDFFTKNIDSIHLKQIDNSRKDSFALALFPDVQKQFSAKLLKSQQSAIEELMSRSQHFFPDLKAKKIFSIILNPYTTNPEAYYSNENQVIIIPLDNYLGEKSVHYQQMHQYLRKYKNPDQILIDIAKSIAILVVKPNSEDTRNINLMIYEGKKMLVLDALLPHIPDAQKINYTAEELQFVQNNEAEIWKYQVQQDNLFRTDYNFASRFIDVAPFSKFYAENDQNTPARVGLWQGWQIVRKYAKNQNYDLLKILAETDAEKIYRESHYKP